MEGIKEMIVKGPFKTQTELIPRGRSGIGDLIDE